jgi:multisubunit Na+/H+ antiporter MnhB subunit
VISLKEGDCGRFFFYLFYGHEGEKIFRVLEHVFMALFIRVEDALWVRVFLHLVVIACLFLFLLAIYLGDQHFFLLSHVVVEDYRGPICGVFDLFELRL